MDPGMFGDKPVGLAAPLRMAQQHFDGPVFVRIRPRPAVPVVLPRRQQDRIPPRAVDDLDNLGGLEEIGFRRTAFVL